RATPPVPMKPILTVSPVMGCVLQIDVGSAGVPRPPLVRRCYSCVSFSRSVLTGEHTSLTQLRARAARPPNALTLCNALSEMLDRTRQRHFRFVGQAALKRHITGELHFLQTGEAGFEIDVAATRLLARVVGEVNVTDDVADFQQRLGRVE